jgi:hypothetical protein
MRRADLNVGDLVWVVLGRSAGRGWARVIRLGEGMATVRFEPGYRHIWEWDSRRVYYRNIVKREEAAA